MWDQSKLDELKDAVATYDRQTVDALCDGLIAWIAASDDNVLPLPSAKLVLSLLRRKLFFNQMRKVADALILGGETHGSIRRQYAQALIECDELTAAIGVLERLIQDSEDAAEVAEARGLVGRALKQQYVDSGPALTKARRRALNLAATGYYEVYKSQPTEYLWHGINAVALAKRAEHDGVVLDNPIDADAIAREILAILSRRTPDNLAAWDYATSMEAWLALDKLPEALESVGDYVRSQLADAFEIASTLRQLKEVWGIGSESRYAGLVAALETAQLEVQGGKVVLRPHEVEEGGKEQRLRRESFEKVFGDREGSVKYNWYREGLTRARAVGRVEDRFGRVFGSGFVTSANFFFAWADAGEVVFVTNSHVLGRLDLDGLRPEDAQVRFEAVDNNVAIPVLDVIWESPKSELDATIVWLQYVPENVELLPLAPAEPPPVFEENADEESAKQEDVSLKNPRVENAKRRFFIIHYPKGGQLELSLHDNTQVGWKHPLLHYRTATDNGSSGSPVFDDQWKLIAIHHAGDKEMPRLDGRPGSYEANEGIWIHEIVRAASQSTRPASDLPRIANAPALPAPTPLAAQAETRREDLVFISYCHMDRKFFGELEDFLTPFSRSNRLRKWTDKDIPIGSDWLREIEKAIDSSRVAVLLVTQKYLASDFITTEEFPRVLQAAERRGVKIFWVAVDHATVKTTALARIQAANDPGRPLREQPPAARNKFWAALAEKIEAAANT